MKKLQTIIVTETEIRHRGQTYYAGPQTVPEDLAQHFLANGWATLETGERLAERSTDPVTLNVQPGRVQIGKYGRVEDEHGHTDESVKRAVAAAYDAAETATKSSSGHAGAKARWGHKQQVTEIIRSLARQRDELGDPEDPASLWPQLFSALDEAGLRPKDHGDRYVFKGGEQTRESFRKAIQRARKDTAT